MQTRRAIQKAVQLANLKAARRHNQQANLRVRQPLKAAQSANLRATQTVIQTVLQPAARSKTLQRSLRAKLKVLQAPSQRALQQQSLKANRNRLPS